MRAQVILFFSYVSSSIRPCNVHLCSNDSSNCDINFCHSSHMKREEEEKVKSLHNCTLCEFTIFCYYFLYKTDERRMERGDFCSNWAMIYCWRWSIVRMVASFQCWATAEAKWAELSWAERSMVIVVFESILKLPHVIAADASPSRAMVIAFFLCSMAITFIREHLVQCKLQL